MRARSRGRRRRRKKAREQSQGSRPRSHSSWGEKGRPSFSMVAAKQVDHGEVNVLVELSLIFFIGPQSAEYCPCSKRLLYELDLFLFAPPSPRPAPAVDVSSSWPPLPPPFLPATALLTSFYKGFFSRGKKVLFLKRKGIFYAAPSSPVTRLVVWQCMQEAKQAAQALQSLALRKQICE